jgi:sterol desaturase/sphingolipid hydroxylase (fatty acid hydroxylase superfamily)
MSDGTRAARDSSCSASMQGVTGAELLTASPRLFDNAVLDKLSRVHWTFPLLYLPIAFLLLWKGATALPGYATVACVLFGYFAWTVSEYVFHRWLFHIDLPGEIGERIHFLLHGVHHVHPNDPLRLVMPPLMSAPLMGLAYVLISILFGAPFSNAVAAGFLIGYVAYDEIHFHLHHRRPRTRIEQKLRRLHLLHHFRDPSRGYGVSAPYWDHVFGTAYTKRDRPGETAV